MHRPVVQYATINKRLLTNASPLRPELSKFALFSLLVKSSESQEFHLGFVVKFYYVMLLLEE